MFSCVSSVISVIFCARWSYIICTVVAGTIYSTPHRNHSGAVATSSWSTPYQSCVSSRWQFALCQGGHPHNRETSSWSYLILKSQWIRYIDQRHLYVSILEGVGVRNITTSSGSLRDQFNVIGADACPTVEWVPVQSCDLQSRGSYESEENDKSDEKYLIWCGSEYCAICVWISIFSCYICPVLISRIGDSQLFPKVNHHGFFLKNWCR
jgi:hypothetical protein